MIDDIRYLIIFAKVAEQGSLTAAANALDLSVSTVSAHLSRLEANLNTALFYRNTRRMTLTSEGASLLATASAMLELYEKGMLEFKQRTVSTAQTLRVAVPAVLSGCRPFMQALAAFSQKFEAATLDMTFSDTREDIVGDGYDVAFRIGELPDSTLKAKPVFQFARTVVASPALLEGKGSLRHPDQAATLPWIGLSMMPSLRTFTHANGDTCTIRYLPRVCVNNVEAAYQLSLCGVGLSAPPTFRAAQALSRGDIVEILPGWTLTPLTVHAVWPANMSASSLAYLLINHVHHQLLDESL
ncbi:LysR family transcriptional regulator [Massilia sp. CF038]|uniref:LysR family transcriptional regulator n=1 Tax=Massilia sp. CF038 TaxID=1881045 RepID=UPI000916CF02|nr:LysR family transcriptional regulator [Massilia sp. CF038]SHG61424.1 DNA-binding transcriptional regulator, LysR family [Massilia sp. CF038]